MYLIRNSTDITKRLQKFSFKLVFNSATMSCKANPSSKSIKFQPMPMAALIANLKTLPATLNSRDSSDSSDESNSSFDNLASNSKKVQRSKTNSTDPKNRVKVPLVENRTAVKHIQDKTPGQVDRACKKENSFNKSFKLPRVDVLPTIEASATTSQPVPAELLQSAHKRLPTDKKESARCLFPEPTKEPLAPKETPTPKQITTFRAVLCPLTDLVSEASHSQPAVPQTPSIAATPSQPQGPKNSSKIQFKTMNIKGKKYMIIEKLGTGGSSEVFRVLEISSSKQYAMKCVDLATDREMAQGYMNEVKLLRDLQQNDRVIKLYEYEYDRPNHFLRLVLEAGETDLACFLRAHRGGAPPVAVLYYWDEMLRAVQQIHDHGIVHADLKPANFLLVRGRLKLIDFGIASAVSGDATSVVRSCGKGTFSYISPEALGGDGSHPLKVSFYSDVWSLGCILYSLVYGHTPFAHLTTMLKLVTIRDPNHCISYPPVDCNIPPPLVTALQACLRYDAHSRPTVAELLQIKYQVTLPDSLLDKLRPHVTPQEYALLQKLRPHGFTDRES